MHDLLKQQLKRQFGDGPIPAEWRDFVAAVDATYEQSEAERQTLVRSLELRSQELRQANSEMRTIFQASPDQFLHVDRTGLILAFKAGAGEDAGLKRGNLSGKRLRDIPALKYCGEMVGEPIRRALESRAVVCIEYSTIRAGEEVFNEARVVPVADDEAVIIIRNITERRRADDMRAGQNQILEMIAKGAPLTEQLEKLVRLVEAQAEGMLCSVLLMDADGKHLRAGAAPSLPAAFLAAIDGTPVGEGVGSCGTASSRKEVVIVADICEDPRWEKFRDLATQHDLRACWSAPIISSDDTVLGTFATFYRQPRGPKAEELKLINMASHIAGIAIGRKHAEEELFNSRHMLRTILDTIPQRVFWKNTQSVYGGCNQPLADDAGYATPEEIIGKTDFQTDAVEVAELYRADDRRVMQSNQPRLNYEEPQFKTNGSLRWLRTSKVPLHDKEGRVIGVLGTYEDITERKQAEVALREAEEKYRNIVENAVEGIFQNVPTGEIIEANPAMARMLGYATPLELMTDITDFRREVFAEPDRYDEFTRLLEKDGVVQRFEARVRRKDGKTVCLSVNARTVRASDGPVLYYEGLAEDVTERKLLEEQFRQAQKMEAFGQLAGGIAHDFNNILTVIQMSVSLLRLDGLQEEERRAAIDETTRAAERAATLTRQLLTFSRRQPIELQHVDLNDVVASMTQMFQRLLGEHITLEARYASGGAMVLADRNMMEQALMNLAVNSRDAMPKGGRLILRTKIVMLSEEDLKSRPGAKPGAYVQLTVSDTGTGIAKQHLPHIFEPFYTTKEIGKGTGLGLATVFGVAEQHDGWIEVESRPNEGTSFHLFFMRLLKKKSATAESESRPSVPRGTETILLVEDEAAVRELMRTLLERNGYTVYNAPSAVDALPMWKEHHDSIDLLLTDMVMPGGMSGRELSDRLRGEKPGLKIIHCSGYSDEMLGSDSRLRSTMNFLEKPFDEHMFLKRVRSCLDSG